jgi:hypothetical protein
MPRSGRLTFAVLVAVSMLAACNAGASPSATPLSPGASPPAELVGKTWKLTGITATTPAFEGVVSEADQPRYTIEFRADGTFKATADCNDVVGTYAVRRGDGQPGPLEPDGGSISILPGASTPAACASGSLGGLFTTGLGNTSSFGIHANQLTITLKDLGKLRFTS